MFQTNIPISSPSTSYTIHTVHISSKAPYFCLCFPTSSPLNCPSPKQPILQFSSAFRAT
jgi:hypothetical protein